VYDLYNGIAKVVTSAILLGTIQWNKTFLHEADQQVSDLSMNYA
jgi:hypothetical protein